jgi:hypothetical protein
MKLDPGMHIGLHLAFFGKAGVTYEFTAKEPKNIYMKKHENLREFWKEHHFDCHSLYCIIHVFSILIQGQA